MAQRPRSVARMLAIVGAMLATSVLLPATAHACSCAAPDLSGIDKAEDRALVVAQRVDLDGGSDGEVEVLRTLLGADVLGPVHARFDNGGSCDPGVRGGALAALVLERSQGNWATTTCGSVPLPTAFEHADLTALPDAHAGPATLLLAGDLAGARLVAVDHAGRTVQTAGADGTTLALAPCPGGNTLVEVAGHGDQLELHRWHLPSLEPLGEPLQVPAGDSWHAVARCHDESGARVVIVAPSFGELGTIAVVTGRQVEVHPAPVEVTAAGPGALVVVLRSDDAGGRPDTIGRVDPTGELVELYRAEGVAFDRLSVAPDGANLLAAGYPSDADGEHIVRVAIEGDDATARRVPGYHALGWRSPTEPWLQSLDHEAFGASATGIEVLGVDLADARTVDVGVGTPLFLDDGVLRLGPDLLPSVLRDGQVIPVADLRLVGATEALVLDRSAVLTAGDTPTPTTPATDPAPPAAPADGGVTTDTAGTWPWLTTTAAAVALAGTLLWRRRRAR